jgi:CHAT domain-containing protein
MRLHEAEPQAGHAAAAFDASELMRGRTLLDHLTDVRADLRQGIEPSLLAREQDLERKLDAKSAELLKLDAGSAAAKALKNEISALRSELQQVAGQIKSRNQRYYSLVYQQPSGLAEIQQRALDADTTLLEYALGEERSFLFVVTRDSVRAFTLPKRAEIEAAASRFHEKLAARGLCRRFEEKDQKLKRIKEADEQLPQAAAELSRMILWPAASALTGKRLLVVGDGELNLIPFTALPMPADNKVAQTFDASSYNSSLLIRKYEVVHLPSASLLAVLRAELKDRPEAPGAVAVFADPVFSAEDERVKALKPAVQASSRRKFPAIEQRPAPMTFARLPRARSAGDCGASGGDFERLKFSAAEAQAIARLTARANRKVLLGFEANEKAALSEELSRYRYIHFATHGLLDGHPELSALVLSLIDREGNPQDGFLRLAEIFKLKLPAELVVLSACETGRGKSARGEGVIGMTRGFFTAGAARVMVSLWKVDDKSTSELMAIFYQNLLQRSLSPAAALREAQLKLIEKQPPYVWSGFVVQGEPK